MNIPKKFLKFLDLINEQLFYNSDYIVVLDQHEWEKRGLEKVDIQQGIAYLGEKNLIRKQSAWNVWEEEQVPVNHEDRQFMLDHDDRGVMSTVIRPEQLEKLKFQVTLLVSESFNKFYTGSTDPKEGMYYNPITGKGWAKGKEFTFKDHQPEFRLFAKLYEHIGETVKRADVLAIMGKTEDTSATFQLTELVKKMRTRTGLNTRELVQNNGNITLVGQKVDDLPNSP